MREQLASTLLVTWRSTNRHRLAAFAWSTPAVMGVDGTDVIVLRAACARDLYPRYLWHSPEGYRDSLGLCLLDAVLATRMSYSAVAGIVDAYGCHRRSVEGEAFTDGVNELRETVAELGCPEVDSVIRAATVFIDFGMLGVADLRRDESSLRPVRQAWRAAIGPGSGAAWAYMMRLAHIPGVPADRHLVGYVSGAIGVSPRRLAPATATRLMAAVAGCLGGTPMHLEHAIWRFQAGRSVAKLPTMSSTLEVAS